jgi:transcriptional regulator with XRE-family HTH domain
MTDFGKFVRDSREALQATEGRRYSLRQVAGRLEVEPTYLSKIERNEVAPPSEKVLVKLASEMRVDSDVLLAMAGKVSSDLQAIILRRPEVFAEMLRQLKDAPDDSNAHTRKKRTSHSHATSPP